MSTDLVKALFTYLNATLIIGGGFILIYLTRGDPTASEIRLLIGGFIGSALTFLFVQENSTRTARASERQFTQGAETASPTSTMTVSSGPPQTVTVTPTPNTDTK